MSGRPNQHLVPARTTLERTLRRGARRGSGTEGEYYRLAYGPGEPRTVRDQLAAVVPGSERAPVSLLRLAHFTDFQIADVQSPGRFEFFESLWGRPGAGLFVPAMRPQEALAVHAVAAMVDTVNRVPPGDETCAPLSLCVSTGDNIDNAQLNELQMFLALLGGGAVRPNSGGPSYEGVQAADWDGDLYWRPDPVPDQFKTRWGFPAQPGLLDEALRPLTSPGLAVPWLSCFGNHDGLVLGTSVPTPGYEAVLSGGRKPVAAPGGVDPLDFAEAFLGHPEVLQGGRSLPVTADPGRVTVGRHAFVSAHLAAPGSPAGHGFGSGNLADETVYGVHDVAGPVPMRVILLDTTNLDGHYEGSIGARQLRWLEERLAEVHSRHLDPVGRWVSTGASDRLVVLASHHGLATMINDRQDPEGLEDDHPRITAGGVEALLHRFPNVVLWLNGHRHLNDVEPRPDPSGLTGGFWEVSTAAVADWPCQARLVEVVADGGGGLAVFCTMLDADVPVDPDGAGGVSRLASLHRELAANNPYSGMVWGLDGKPADRNVALTLRAPFPLGI
jgi:metallophosphoesterase (TIGR03767 family)